MHEQAFPILKRTAYYPTNENYKLECFVAGLYYLIVSPSKIFYSLRLAIRFGRVRWFFRSLLWAKELERLGIEHMHAHFVSRSANAARFISILTGIGYSFTSHAEDMYRYAYEGREEELVDLSNHSKFHVTVCKYNLKFMEKNFPGLDAKILRMAYCGVNPQEFPFHPETNGGPINILAVGRLVEKKGFPYLVKAFGRLKGKIEFKCEIIGDGPLREKLESLIKSYDLKDYVSLSGAKTQQEIAECLRECDLFVLPCVNIPGKDMDSCPVVLKEAMSLGKPVISTNISGIPELLEPDVGILVAERDSKELTDAILYVYNLHKKERYAMGTTGRALIERKFNVIKETKKLYNWIIESSKGKKIL